LDGLPESGNLGLGWFGRQGDWTYDRDNTDSGTYQVVGGYGKSIGHRTALGYGLTFQNDNVDSDTHNYESSQSFLHTLGVQNMIDDDTTWGSTVFVGHGYHDLDHLADARPSQSVSQLSVGWGGGIEHRMGSTSLAGGLDFTFMRNNGTNDPAVNDVVFGGDSLGRVMNVIMIVLLFRIFQEARSTTRGREALV
jgi:hypothetical protein